MEPEAFDAARRAYLATEYRHHKRMANLSPLFSSRDYHRALMVRARQAFLQIEKATQ